MAGTGENGALWRFVLLVVLFFVDSKGFNALCRLLNERSLLNTRVARKQVIGGQTVIV